MKVFNCIFFIAILISCDAGRRIQRICKRNPESCKQDTVKRTITDTVTIKGFRVDTVFAFNPLLQHDTIYLQKENVIVKWKYNNNGTVYLGVEQKPTTHIFKHEISIVNTAVTFKKHWADYLALVLSIIAGFFICVGYLKTHLTKTAQFVINTIKPDK